MVREERLGMRIDSELKEAALAKAHTLDMTLSQVVRQLLRQWLAEDMREDVADALAAWRAMAEYRRGETVSWEELKVALSADTTTGKEEVYE